MKTLQTAILDEAMPDGRFIIMNLKKSCEKKKLKQVLNLLTIDEYIVIGFGKNLLNRLGIKLAPYREFPTLDAQVKIPATHGDIFVFIRDQEPGKVAIRCLQVMNILSGCFELQLQVNGFRYLAKPDQNGHDLTGYEDGTENPTDNDAINAVTREDGSCFVVVQQWLHDLNEFNGFSQKQKDHTIGRSLSDNKELEDAPASSHVNRSDQGTFEIDADILRRSMPFSDESGDGLMFLAYCENLDRFEVQMKRMAGLVDGIVDALFTFSQPINSAYFYCPATEEGRLIIK